MNTHTLEHALLHFDKIAREDNAAAYVVDVFLKGGAWYVSSGVTGILSGIMKRPDKNTGTVLLEISLYGSGTDFNTCVIECEAIAAVRMRKPL